MIKKAIKNFFYFTASSEMLLVFATIAGLLIANSSHYNLYTSFFFDKIIFDFGFLKDNLNAKFSIKLIIDDFLMAIFFLLIGLELKREVLVGELSSRAKLLLPVVGAIGGVLTPALVFCYFNIIDDENLRGFAIPTATDIAFAYAVVKAFGNKISNAAKVFLISLAVVDDLIAIFIIAFFYTEDLHAMNLLFSFFVMFGLFLLHARKSQNIHLYMTLGFALWIFVFASGVHPSIAGVALAMFIPFKTKDNFMLEDLAKKLSPLIGFFILPIFDFANSGVNVDNFSSTILLDNLVLGIIAGLFFGKQIGVFLFSFFAIKLKICNLPKGGGWLELYGISIITGIGFTMALFIGNLAFDNMFTLDKVKIGVLLGSLASFIYATLILLMVKPKKQF